MNEERTLSRRSVLGAAATGAAVALAGCADGGTQGEGDEDNPEAEATPEAEASPEEGGGQPTEGANNSSGEVPHAEGEGTATERDLNEDDNESAGGAGGNSTNSTNSTNETGDAGG